MQLLVWSSGIFINKFSALCMKYSSSSLVGGKYFGYYFIGINNLV